MDIAVVTVSWNTKALLEKCLLALRQELARLPRRSAIFVVDNNSVDGSAAMVRQNFPEVKLIANAENLGFAAANNQVLSRVAADWYLLLNPDTEIRPGAVAELLEFAAANPRAGVVAPQLLNGDGTVQRSCRSFPTLAGMAAELSGFSRLFPLAKFSNYKMLDFDHASVRAVDQPEGACLLVRKQVLDQVGLFDEKFFMLFEEVDWCFRVKEAGWEIWFIPQAKVIHHYGQSIKQVKAKMIYFSHRGFFRYLMKHSRSAMVKVLSPFIYVGLMALAGLRILAYYGKRLLPPAAGRS
jgi:N-acetylglucosaminyl-diphospho-decaprenol L-rhamnosyltransferase